jgi:serine/threonine protein phosphatase PrpC
VKLSTAGGRLIIASDGVWDALSPEVAFNCSRELPPEPAAEQIVKVIPLPSLSCGSLNLVSYSF